MGTVGLPRNSGSSWQGTGDLDHAQGDRVDATLSELRQPEVLFKVGTSSYNWSTIGTTSGAARIAGLDAATTQMIPASEVAMQQQQAVQQLTD